MTRSVTIIGGGLAGLTLGIGLRKKNIPVTIIEARRYPHHRVCGEFISGVGLETLERLELSALLENSGASHAHTAAFFSQHAGTPPWRLPTPALCLSRFVLDDSLATEFRRLGGELREGERWTEKYFSNGVVRATGRRARPKENGHHWFGVKAHAQGVSLVADLELHVMSHGYVGLCRINSNTVNVCGLFRSNGRHNNAQPQEFLRGPIGSSLHRRLESARFDETSVCAIAGLSLKPHRAAERNEICVGDAVTMIPPVTGNGMSMALESAEIAIEPLAKWSRGELAWDDAREWVARRCDAAFATRLRWARRLQCMLFSPVSLIPLIFVASRSETFWRFWFARTR